MALRWCLQCPSTHPLHVAALAVVKAALRSNRYKRNAATALRIDERRLSELLRDFPQLRKVRYHEDTNPDCESDSDSMR